MMTNEELVAPQDPQAPQMADASGESATTNTPEKAQTTPPAEATAPAPTGATADATETEGDSAPAVETADDLELFDAAMAEMEQMGSRTSRQGDSSKRLSRGDRIEATVIQVEKDRVFVDLGTKSEGVVPLSELTEENVSHAQEVVKVGDKIQVVVIKTDGGDGNPVVSKKRADFDEAWRRVVEAFQNQETLNAQVVDRVKGGLLVDVGVRGFVPATHVGSGKLRNIEKYVGESLLLKVIEIDKERKKVVLSNRAAEEEHKEQIKEDIFNKVNPGDIVKGSVRRLTDYGAFVDLGGIDGLLHISEMSWMRISHPKEVLKEGQEVDVMVLRLDKSIGKISLGLRQVLPDPWNLIKENYKIGQKFNATITRMVQSGAFIRLPEGAEAFLPVSEISHRRINKPSDVLADNQEVEVTIIDLRPDERRMVLSLKSGSMPEQQIGYGYGPSVSSDFDTDRNRNKKKKKKGRGREDEFDGGAAPSRGAAGGGATIGERLGMLKGFHFRSDDEESTEEAEAAPAPEAPAQADAAPAEQE